MLRNKNAKNTIYNYVNEKDGDMPCKVLRVSCNLSYFQLLRANQFALTLKHRPARHSPCINEMTRRVTQIGTSQRFGIFGHASPIKMDPGRQILFPVIYHTVVVVDMYTSVGR